LSGKLAVGVVFGGRSAEHQVSIVSARSVINALDTRKYNIIPIGITPNGQWVGGEQALHMLEYGSCSDVSPVFLPADPTVRQLLSIDQVQPVLHSLDVMFPVLHGPYGEDGSIQGLFDLIDIPYVGAGVPGSAVAMDKVLQKQVCRESGLPTTAFLWLREADWRVQDIAREQPLLRNQLANLSQPQMLDTIEMHLGMPVFIKPANLGSSVGITKAHAQDELEEGINLAFSYDRKLLIEMTVPNTREIEVAVLGNEHPKAAIPGEIVPSNEFYDYDAKYVDGASDIFIPADLPEMTVQALQIAALKGVSAVNVEGMARVDFLVNSETLDFFLNEINTIPGFTSISMYPKMWEASGLSYPNLLDELISLALDRQAKKQSLNTKYQPKTNWHVSSSNK